MELVEFIRVRRSLIWHAGILLALVLAIMALGQQSSVNINNGGTTTHWNPGMGLPFGVLATVAAFLAAIYASSIGTSLNRESGTRDISWTKPVSRTVLAVRFMLIDLGGVVLAFILALAAIFVVFAHWGVMPNVGPQAAAQLALGAGIGTMWYALLQMLTCWLPPGGRSLAGILWPVALVLEGLAQLGGSVGALIRAIDVVNPLVYVVILNVSNPQRIEGMVPHLPAAGGALVVWCFTLLFCAVAAVLWPRREA